MLSVEQNIINPIWLAWTYSATHCSDALTSARANLFCFYLGSQFFIKLLLSVSGLLYLGSEFFIELLLSVSRLLYLGSQFFIELLLSVEQNINRRFS